MPPAENHDSHAFTPGQSGVDTRHAAEYWNRILDPQNLECDPDPAPPGKSLHDEIVFAGTPDLDEARRWLEGARPAWIVDLGAGLGANTFALAARGHILIAVDTSPARLKALRERARQAGLADRIHLVVGNAESLPFAAASIPALFTRSVLIHTRPELSAAELARVLTPGGRAALIEPETGNPFVRLYRATLAPPAWRAITLYFTPAIQAVYLNAPGLTAPCPAVVPFYFLSFGAFVFMYGWPRPRLFRLALRLLGGLDALLFRLCPPLRRWAWFGVVKLEKQRSNRH